MLIIELAPLQNGAHRNQICALAKPPAGWATVPQELEEEAVGYLPFIDLTVENGEITAVAQGAIPEPEPDTEPEPAEEAATKADVRSVWDAMAAAYSEGVNEA